MMIGMDGKAANLYCQYDYIYCDVLTMEDAEEVQSLVDQSKLAEKTKVKRSEKMDQQMSRRHTIPPACMMR